MFAVVILGIGFIMVAAIFPVALQQAKATSDEVNATTIARSATNQFSQFLRDGNGGTATSNCKPLTNSASIAIVQQLSSDNTALTPPAVSLWTSLSGNMILSQDPRFAWVSLYRRGATDPNQTGTWVPYVQLFVFPVQVRNRTLFTSDDTKLYTSGPYWNTNKPTANLMPHPVRVIIANDVADAGGADLIAFDTSGNDEEAFDVAAVAEGAYVVIADDGITSPAADKGLMNGRIFKVGARRSDLDGLSNMSDAYGNTVFPINTTEVYELAPGNEFTPDPGADGKFGNGSTDDILDIGMSAAGAAQSSIAHGFVIGRGYADPNNPSSGFEGDAMPISAFTTYLRVQ